MKSEQVGLGYLFVYLVWVILFFGLGSGRWFLVDY